MKYCPNCGKELFDEAVMCPNCKIAVSEQSVIEEKVNQEIPQENESEQNVGNVLSATAENINQNETEENPPQTQEAFCSMCGKPVPLGEKLCTDCINKQYQSAPNQMRVIPTPKKERKPLSKKSKAIIIFLVAIILAALLAFGGFKTYQHIEKKQNEEVQSNVTAQIKSMNFGEFSNTDSDGNVTVLYTSESGDTAGTIYLLKLLLNKESGLLVDSDDPTDAVQTVFASKNWNYIYDKNNSHIKLKDSNYKEIGKVQVKLNDNKKIESFTYDNVKYEKTDKKTATLVKECNDFIKREGTVLNSVDNLESKLRLTKWKYDYSSIIMGNLLDTSFESYTIYAHADRDDENTVHLYIKGALNPYVYSGYNSDDYTMQIDYSISDDTFTIIDDSVEGGWFTLRDMYYSYRYRY